MNKTATFIKKEESNNEMSMGHVIEIYKINPPLPHDWDFKTNEYQGETEYVYISQANVFMSGWETFIFPYDIEKGEVIDWIELEGSTKGYYTPEEVLIAEGDKIVDQG